MDALERQLKALPKTLEETYDQILLRINEDYQESALRILRWLAFSARPVTIRKAAEVLAINWSNNPPHYDARLKLLEPRDVLLLCSTLVTTYTASIFDTAEIQSDYYEYEPECENTEIVRLAHLSVKEYLLSDRIRFTEAAFYATDANLAHQF